MPRFQIFQYNQNSFKTFHSTNDLYKKIENLKKENLSKKEGFLNIIEEENNTPTGSFVIDLKNNVFYLEYGIDRTTEVLSIEGVREVQYLERLPIMIFVDYGYLTIFHTVKNEVDQIRKLIEERLDLKITGNPITPSQHEIRNIMESEDARATRIGHAMGADEVSGFSRNLLNTDFWRQAQQGYLKSLRTNMKISNKTIIFGFYTQKPTIAILNRQLPRKDQADAIKWLIDKYLSKKLPLQTKL